MKTLHLNLKAKWFGMIFRGEKPEEYRDIKPYWKKRLSHLFPQEIRGETLYPIVDSITFSNGYAEDRPQFVIELKGIEIREGNPEWGAQEGKKYFVLKLGEILQDVNCCEFLYGSS